MTLTATLSHYFDNARLSDRKCPSHRSTLRNTSPPISAVPNIAVRRLIFFLLSPHRRGTVPFWLDFHLPENFN